VAVRKLFNEAERTEFDAKILIAEKELRRCTRRVLIAVHELVAVEKFIEATSDISDSAYEDEGTWSGVMRGRYLAIDKLWEAREREYKTKLELEDLRNRVEARLELVPPEQKP
jgi:hypothetical protein